MSTKHHISTSIPGLLRQSDKVLARMFQMPATEIRRELQERLAKGEKLIPSEGCEGFDPVHGCPGHAEDGGKISLLREYPEVRGGREEIPYELPVIIRDEQNLLN